MSLKDIKIVKCSNNNFMYMNDLSGKQITEKLIFKKKNLDSLKR